MLLLGHQPRIALEYLTAALQMKTFMNLCLSSGTPVLRWMLMMSGTYSFCILCYWITRNINQYWNFDHNAPSQMQRLRPALQARTRQMRGTGQEEWNHACELCSWVYTDEDNTKRGSDNVRLLNVTQIFL